MKKYILLVLSLFVFVACGQTETPVDQNDDQVNEDVDPNEEEAPITVSAPEAGETVEFPLIVRGEARGNWYFEASFGVDLVDDEGNVLATTYAQAQGDWMQPGMVEFEGKFDSVETDATSGKLIFRKDNPSGLPENDASFELPVKF